jgi:hypothetical protein
VTLGSLSFPSEIMSDCDDAAQAAYARRCDNRRHLAEAIHPCFSQRLGRHPSLVIDQVGKPSAGREAMIQVLWEACSSNASLVNMAGRRRAQYAACIQVRYGMTAGGAVGLSYGSSRGKIWLVARIG